MLIAEIDLNTSSRVVQWPPSLCQPPCLPRCPSCQQQGNYRNYRSTMGSCLSPRLGVRLVLFGTDDGRTWLHRCDNTPQRWSRVTGAKHSPAAPPHCQLP